MVESLVCSSGSEAALAAQINKFWYSKDWTIKDKQAFHPKLGYKGRVEVYRGRYRFYL